MATYTSNYNLSKPESTDTNASFISAYRDNMDIIDKQMGNKNIAEEYDNTQTYAVDDYVIYDGDLYKCVTAVTSAEDFDSTKWTRTVASDEFGSGGGGGGSTVTYTPTLTEGTKTGEISIDGTSTDMYAPTPITDSSDITYDNTDSGLSATNVQDAIDEVVDDGKVLIAARNALRGKTQLYVYNGNEFDCVTPAQMGYDGMMVGGGCFHARMTKAIFELAKAGKIDEAKALQERMNDLMFDVFGGKEIACWLAGQKQIMVDLGVFSTNKCIINYQLTPSCAAAIKTAMQREKEFIYFKR